MSDETYAYLDFAVIVAPQIDVLRAAADMCVGQADGPPILGLPKDHRGSSAPRDPRSSKGVGHSKGMFGHLRQMADQWLHGGEREELTRRPEYQKTDSDFSEPLLLHCDDASELDRLITWSVDQKTAGLPIEKRVSALAEHPGWTMVEFAEPGSGLSLVSASLSAKLTGAQVYYFRRSGAATDEPHFDFHCYVDGQQRRRVMSHLTGRKNAKPSWKGSSDGAYLPFEDPILYDRADAAVMMTANKQLALFEMMGLSMSSLFGIGARADAVLISDKPGGAPVSVLFS